MSAADVKVGDEVEVVECASRIRRHLGRGVVILAVPNSQSPFDVRLVNGDVCIATEVRKITLPEVAPEVRGRYMIASREPVTVTSSDGHEIVVSHGPSEALWFTSFRARDFTWTPVEPDYPAGTVVDGPDGTWVSNGDGTWSTALAYLSGQPNRIVDITRPLTITHRIEVAS